LLHTFQETKAAHDSRIMVVRYSLLAIFVQLTTILVGSTS
jgi:hypothetical protein